MTHPRASRPNAPVLVEFEADRLTVFHPPGPSSLRIIARRYLTEPPTLEEMQREVGGYVELVCAVNVEGHPCQVYVNEEGRLKGLPDNLFATRWVEQVWQPLDHLLVGPVVVLTGRKAVWK